MIRDFNDGEYESRYGGFQHMSKPPFAVGDKVTTDFDLRDCAIVRTVTRVVRYAHCESGWLASADRGHQCSRCRRAGAEDLTGLDSSWFHPVTVCEQDQGL